jgi:hypothetical protein
LASNQRPKATPNWASPLTRTANIRAFRANTGNLEVTGEESSKFRVADKRKYGERMLNEVRGNLAVTLEALVCGDADGG